MFSSFSINLYAAGTLLKTLSLLSSISFEFILLICSILPNNVSRLNIILDMKTHPAIIMLIINVLRILIPKNCK